MRALPLPVCFIGGVVLGMFCPWTAFSWQGVLWIIAANVLFQGLAMYALHWRRSHHANPEDSQ